MRFYFKFLLLFLSFIACRLNAMPVYTYSQLKEFYLHLRNTDDELKRLSDWQNLAKQQLIFVEQNQAAAEAPIVLLQAYNVREQLYLHYGVKVDLEDGEKLLKWIILKYPDSNLADDALEKLANLRLKYYNDKKSAVILYEKIIHDYPNSDMHDVALVQLQKLKSPKHHNKDITPKYEKNLTFTDAVKRSSRGIIVLDPGHGGEDAGAIGVAGLLEKDVVLAVANELKLLIERNTSYAVLLTRTIDRFVPLAKRTAIANNAHVKMFVSLHVNASEDQRASGVEVYYLDNTNDAASIKMAERENASINYEGANADLYLMLSDLIQNSKLTDSVLLAKNLDKALVNNTSTIFNKISNRGVKKAPFYVLVGAHVPCVLVEMFFISNPTEGINLGKQDFRKNIAKSLYLGIVNYLREQRYDRQ